MRRFEVCCGDIESLQQAYNGGATRVELCTGLAEGGLTPPASMIRYAAGMGIKEINVLIRPRGGDFLYSELEKSIMLQDIRDARDAGATGIVTGALTPDGDIDTEWLAKVMQEKGDMTLTFHRAFDLCRKPEQAMEDIISAGCDCILTSGCAPTAQRGVELLRRMVKQAMGRIDIMAGSGVTRNNAREIAEFTGVPILHSTARSIKCSGMKYHRSDVSMGTPADEYSRLSTDSVHVKAIMTILNEIE